MTTPWENETERRALQRMTLALVESCFRNSIIENWRAGREVISPAGDCSDVKIVSPAGEIPYLEASRISDPEMKAWTQQVVDAVFVHLRLSRLYGDLVSELLIDVNSRLSPCAWIACGRNSEH